MCKGDSQSNDGLRHAPVKEALRNELCRADSIAVRRVSRPSLASPAQILLQLDEAWQVQKGGILVQWSDHQIRRPQGTELTLEEGQYEADALLCVDDIDCYPCSHDESIVHRHTPAPPCPEASWGQVIVQNAPHLQCTGAQIPFCRLWISMNAMLQCFYGNAQDAAPGHLQKGPPSL